MLPLPFIINLPDLRLVNRPENILFRSKAASSDIVIADFGVYAHWALSPETAAYACQLTLQCQVLRFLWRNTHVRGHRKFRVYDSRGTIKWPRQACRSLVKLLAFLTDHS